MSAAMAGRIRSGSSPLHGHERRMFRWTDTSLTSPLSEHLDAVDAQQGGLPEPARRLIHAPEWASIVYIEGWTEPGTCAWVTWRTPGSTMDLYFDRVLGSSRYLPADVGEGRKPAEVKLSVRHRIVSDGQGRFTYREDPVVLVVVPDTEDSMEFLVDDATILLGALRRGLQLVEGSRNPVVAR